MRTITWLGILFIIDLILYINVGIRMDDFYSDSNKFMFLLLLIFALVGDFIDLFKEK